jgi:hypothetical protein
MDGCGICHAARQDCRNRKYSAATHKGISTMVLFEALGPAVLKRSPAGGLFATGEIAVRCLVVVDEYLVG